MSKPNKDGWIRWRGGKNAPVEGSTMVDVRLRCGFVDIGEARLFYWEHANDPGDIMAYRVLDQPEPKPKQDQPNTKWVPFTIDEIKVGDVVMHTADSEKGVVVAENGKKLVVDWRDVGFLVHGSDDLAKLRKKKQTREAWVNVYTTYNTKEEADANGMLDRVTCVKIEIEE